jgi:hypothetical protein
VRTLDFWEDRLTAVPSTIECAEMHLLSGNDHEPPIFVGPGHIDIRSSTAIDFTMFATPSDNSDALRRLVRARENPYDAFEQFRLVATDYQGTKWACGSSSFSFDHGLLVCAQKPFICAATMSHSRSAS